MTSLDNFNKHFKGLEISVLPHHMQFKCPPYKRQWVVIWMYQPIIQFALQFNYITNESVNYFCCPIADLWFQFCCNINNIFLYYIILFYPLFVMLDCADLNKGKISELIFSAEARIIKSSSTGSKMGDKSPAFRTYPFFTLTEANDESFSQL